MISFNNGAIIPIPQISIVVTFDFIFYLPYLSSIHEKANCIAIFWTGRPHSLRSCHLRCVWATCLPLKGGGVPLSALPKDTTSELAACSPQPSPNVERQAGKQWIPFLKVIWYDSTGGLNPKPNDCEADALITTPSRRSSRENLHQWNNFSILPVLSHNVV